MNGHDHGGAAPVELEGYDTVVAGRTHAERAAPAEAPAPVKRRTRTQVLAGVKNTARAIREHIVKMIEVGDEFDTTSFAFRMLTYMGHPPLDPIPMSSFKNSVSSELSKLKAAGVVKVVKRTENPETGGFWNTFVLVTKTFNTRNGVADLIETAGDERAAEEGLRIVPAEIAAEGLVVPGSVASKVVLADRIDALLKIADTFERLGPKIMELGKELLDEVRAENQKPRLELASVQELSAELNARLQRVGSIATTH